MSRADATLRAEQVRAGDEIICPSWPSATTPDVEGEVIHVYDDPDSPYVQMRVLRTNASASGIWTLERGLELEVVRG